MPNWSARYVAATFLVLGMLVSGTPSAAPTRLAQADSAGVQISRERAAALAASRTGGRVLDVRLQRGARPVYRVKVLVSGERVRTVRVDAATGAVLD
jgi:uncharacterized membrane protein YkoI